jgi:hypothetical protein
MIVVHPAMMLDAIHRFHLVLDIAGLTLVFRGQVRRFLLLLGQLCFKRDIGPDQLLVHEFVNRPLQGGRQAPGIGNQALLANAPVLQQLLDDAQPAGTGT